MSGGTVQNLGQKARDLLALAAVDPAHPSRGQLHAEACHRYSAKAVARKFQELAHRGYLTLGPAGPSQASLTDKGRQALESVMVGG